jgi:uncharacterized membrane protein
MKTLRVLHILGLVLFLGSIFSFIVASHAAGSNADAIHFARQTIALGTYALTVPGMGLAVITGAAMAFIRWRSRRELPPWLLLKMLFGLIIVANATFVLVPAVNQLTKLSEELASPAGAWELFTSIANREEQFGKINVLLILLSAGLGVFQPRLKKTHPVEARSRS